MTARSWDAAAYHRVSVAMDAMAAEVLDRLPLDGSETVLDAGCGTGRISAKLLARLPRGRLIAVDADPEMVAIARETLPEVLRVDLLDLALPEPVDAIFSTATFHWVLDHDRLFDRLAAVLRPGGRLVAQCGGAGNIAALRAAADQVAALPAWRSHFADFAPPFLFADPSSTRRRLTASGFVDIECWLQPFPVASDEMLAYLETVPLGPWVQRVPSVARAEFVAAVWERTPGDTVDYVRLNITARRG
ncbi:trans-aconitate 2-methyltransferase [Asanoa ishikariensis]|uniref:Trans-aconitate 2-methyltransferase n=1 Tax=Asanoa ishikariensis TaxID=137265 RepID=A0A1H3UVL8_9ACTN|nr:methyltransferase domain-containing protein [Asanoa ishikariensis]GIF65062.1 trans-aconitate 2-methyltransferase [Asanoa ishikariensis]SDZ66071.1 trans-aconitate 2-methyltransferase [Asanoa ishikariensis]